MTTHFEITVTLPPEPVENLVRQIWTKNFSLPDRNYNRDFEYGYIEVERQVKQYINQLDLTDIIAIAARNKLQEAVETSVDYVLKQYAKKRATEMLKNGTLMGEVK